jgi:hypothetical protein
VASAGIFIGWGDTKTGRERRSLVSFQGALAYFGQLQANGEIESFEPVFLQPHGGDLSGFLLLRGEPEKLGRVQASPEFNRIVTEASLLLNNFGVVNAFLGDGLQGAMGMFDAEISKLE